MMLRSAWLQKHPSPVATAGEFHWYPADGDRDLHAELVSRAHGIEPPAVLWELARGRVVWARAFAAHAPTDGRRYVGLAVAVAESDGAAPSELLAALAEPEAAPWTPELAIADGIDAAGRVASLRSHDEAISDDNHDAIALARALIAQGIARVSAQADCRALLARLDAVMPVGLVDRARRGVCVVDDAATAQPDRVAELAVAACARPLSNPARGWRLLCELAVARTCSLDEAWTDAERRPSRSLSDEESAALRGERPRSEAPSWFATTTVDPERLALVDILHYWGRGWFDLCPTAGTIVERLADAVASQALVALAAGGDADAAIADARWHAVLPAARREALRETLVARVPSLASSWSTDSGARSLRMEARHG